MGLAEQLVKESSLTVRQLESLISYRRVASGEIKFREAASVVSQGRTRGDAQKVLTVGSYYRTLSQARMNIKQSLVTILIGMQSGVVRPEELRRLFELVSMGGRELSEDEVDRFMRVLQALLNRIVL